MRARPASFYLTNNISYAIIEEKKGEIIMLFLLFLACMIATTMADEIHYGWILAGLTYFIFAFYGIAYTIATFVR